MSNNHETPGVGPDSAYMELSIWQEGFSWSLRPWGVMADNDAVAEGGGAGRYATVTMVLYDRHHAAPLWSFFTIADK